MHLCGPGCSAEIGVGTAMSETVLAGAAVGLVGTHDANANPYYLLNEHFVR